MNSQECWMVYAVHDEQSEMFAKSRSRSRFEKERTTARKKINAI
jgi:hypothetical protein